MSGVRSQAEDTARRDFAVWSTTATLSVTDPATLDAAAACVNDVIAEVDTACSRFRDDSEISRLLRRPGHPATLSPVLNAALAHSLRVASATGYLVDPTVAAAVIAAGYDRDIAAVRERGMKGAPWNSGSGASAAAPGAWRLRHDPGAAELTIPAGIGIDLGATAKAFATDRAAARIAELLGGGVLVGLGGDIAVAGESPDGGWRISVSDDHRGTALPYQTVSITAGGLATSSTTVRRWPTATGWKHHIIDPRTGTNPPAYWRTASVAAASCVDANAAATAAIIMGEDAPQWLAGRDLPALLVDMRGVVTAVAGWPAVENL